MRWVIALTVVLIAVGAARAQPAADHLKCYKVRDPQPKVPYTADLGGLVAEPGCRIKVPAVMACVPATKTNVTPNPPESGGTGTVPSAFGCYKVKCPKTALPTLALNDQFGSRSVTPIAAKLLCAPSSPTTTTTTTTTMPPGCIVTGVGAPCDPSSSVCCPVQNGSVFCGGNPTTCRLGVCDPGFGNCNNEAADGCERDLRSDSSNCGFCGHSCPVGTSCVTAACQ
jgi:hypothetical protein